MENLNSDKGQYILTYVRIDPKFIEENKVLKETTGDDFSEIVIEIIGEGKAKFTLDELRKILESKWS